MENFIKEMRKQGERNDILFDDKQLEAFHHYMELLLEWNEKINLTAITEQNEVVLKHFIDCNTVLPYINGAKKLIDVGTGAGFPGVPIKIMKPDVEIVLLDSLNKRIQFLEEVIHTLDLEKIEAKHARAEELARDKKMRETFDVATSRAVAKLNVLLEYMMPFVKVGGKCICMKSNNIEEEVGEAKKAITTLGGEIENIEEVTLGDSNITRKIVIIRKTKPTPKQFPRKAGTPLKKPII